MQFIPCFSLLLAILEFGHFSQASSLGRILKRYESRIETQRQQQQRSRAPLGTEMTPSYPGPLRPSGARLKRSLSPLGGNNTRDKGVPGTRQAVDLSRNLNRTVPQYMLDLFNRFANDTQDKPASNTIRSFFNEASEQSQRQYQANYQSCTVNQQHWSRNCSRKHLLSFDISSISSRERIELAELRLYKIVEMDRKTFIGTRRKVDVFELIKEEALDGQTFYRKILIDSKRNLVQRSGWETFYISRAVRRWVRSHKKLHHLEVWIENIGTEMNEEPLGVEIEENPQSSNEPLLIVYSDGRNEPHGALRHDVQDLMRPNQHKNHPHNHVLAPPGPKMASEILSRKRRSSRGNCHLEPMTVNFKEIGYSWVVRPLHYEAGKCVGRCHIPLQGQDTTNYAVIKAWMFHKSKGRHRGPCCVPVKLGPISLLYEENSVVAFGYNYEEMRVVQCGCR